MDKLSKWVQGQPIEGAAVPPQGIEITSLGQFLAQFTAAELATCPTSLLPTFDVRYGLQFDDVCHCMVNGGAARSIHAMQLTCYNNVNEETEVECGCVGEAHKAGCPFDMCPIAQCHPLCYQVTGHGEDIYCHCACHG